MCAKIYENAQKLFQLGQRRIGIAAFGLGNLGVRTIGSYIREFESQNPNKVVSENSGMAEVVDELRRFFLRVYMETVAPILASALGRNFEQLPPDKVPVLGLVVAGFPSDEYLSEVWEILIPVHKDPNSCILRRGQGDLGSNWFAMYEPIFRYLKGFDRQTVEKLKLFV